MTVQFPLQSSTQDEAEARFLLKPTSLPDPALPSPLSLIPFLVSPKSTVSIKDIYENCLVEVQPHTPLFFT